MEEDYLQKKEAHEKLMAKLKAKIQGISEAMAQNTLDAAKQMIIEQGLVETVYTGLTRLSAEIEAIRAAKNKPLLDDLDMQAVLDRFDSFRQGADDYVDVYKWLCIVAVNKWLMGEPVVGDDEHEPERPENDKLTRAQELIIRTILKKVINRIALDFENELALNKKRKKKNDKLRETYLSQKITDKSIIDRINREYQAVSDQLDNIHDSLNESKEDWNIFTEMFLLVLKNEPLSKTKEFLNSIMAIELRRGLSLLQKDIKKRRINKPNIEDPEYIEKIIREYKEYRVNFKEYQEITYWLNIAEADKWLEYVVVNSKEDYGNNIINTLSYDLYELEEQEDFEKSKKQSYIDFGSDIKEKLSEPEKTFLGLSAELIYFIKKRKRKITEQTLRELTWWFFEKDSTDKDGMPCKGIGTREELTEFYVRYNDFTRMCLVKTHATIQIEELIQGLHDETPENAIICLEGLLKQNEKRDLREAHLGMIDINADWRHYIIEIIKKEIQFHERRLELEKVKLETSKKQEADNNEARLGIEEEFKKDTRPESAEVDSKNIIHSRQSAFASLKQKRSWPQFVSHNDVIYEFIRISKQEAITETKALVEIFWGLYGDALQGQESGLMQACYNTKTFKKKMEAAQNE